MTSWPEQPADGQPPLTRRQARESERTAARQESRRAGTAEPTPGGEIPVLTNQGSAPAAPVPAAPATEPPAIPASAFADPGVVSPSRPQAGGNDFDALLFAEPGASAPADESADERDDSAPSALFREAADPTKPEAVTQPVAVVPPAAPAPAPTAAATGSGERTLTRREMRAMMQAQEANQQANHAPHLAEPVVPIAFNAPGTPASQESADEAHAEQAPADDTKAAWPFAPLTPSNSTGTSEQAEAPFVPTPAAPPVQTSAPTSPFTAFGLAPSSAATPKPAEVEDTSAQERRPFTPPTGHWSTAAEVEDASEPIISRNVGQSTAATTTNALILPSIPRPDATAPLTSTGEILVTGSIDLPRGVGSTGLNPEHLDSSDIDNLLDGEENEFNTSEVAPVRASRAISTHTSTRGVITPPKKRGNALPTVLIVVAGVLAVGVIGLLVAAYWLKVF
ncbi:hypothetical protein [Leifsonia aquatica]|uniref:hypothetical protein n=1 Tax=Leifsonia aquatica TaxID=144185 RepID=UPI0028B043A8|nr:hypothetical protein [Leifsonia aquatica]